MVLRLDRIHKLSDCTIGKLFIDNVFECYTLEDVVRAVKIPNETAIPAGAYDVVIDDSPKYKRLMPHILDVPNFIGIRIHSGNTDKDTSGCILVGDTLDLPNQRILNSRIAFNRLFRKLQAADKIMIWIDAGHERLKPDKQIHSRARRSIET